MQWLIQLLTWIFEKWISWLSPKTFYHPIKRNHSDSYIPYNPKNTKPDWVKYKVLVLKAYLPHNGCRKIAAHFNRQYGHTAISVSKSYVYRIVRDHRYEIMRLRKKLKHHIPKALPKNLIWSMDLTTINMNQTIGIIDSGTRALLILKHLPAKSTINILRVILDAIEIYGKPKIVKSDNEAIFISKILRFAFWILGIKQQRTDIASPWQNGKIERLFGTLKPLLRKLQIHPSHLQNALNEFRLYYNHMRPHHHLHGKTPSEAWDNKPITTSKETQEIYSFKGEHLPITGFYMRV
ncbi:integrase core domain-containing protein [Sulfuricurvum sp.]|uniref:integrase core domain-containing protein n=1 Tax=Sulfuricurvum sp. TaxID=2025608 RepID=UPI002631DCDE|nr:integrase core domain-containing protein [Sulfuricurvum sp.]MDD3597416.1 integrase core domain-containing protein [Sulfuricurvum sp.]